MMPICQNCEEIYIQHLCDPCRLKTLKTENARLQADLELARLALEEAVVAMDEHKFKDVWAP